MSQNSFVFAFDAFFRESNGSFPFMQIPTLFTFSNSNVFQAQMAQWFMQISTFYEAGFCLKNSVILLAVLFGIVPLGSGLRAGWAKGGLGFSSRLFLLFIIQKTSASLFH